MHDNKNRLGAVVHVAKRDMTANTVRVNFRPVVIGDCACNYSCNQGGGGFSFKAFLE
jgi:hypothetical protein